MAVLESVEVRKARETWQQWSAQLKQLYLTRDELYATDAPQAKIDFLRAQIATAREDELKAWRTYCALFDDMTLAAARLLRAQIDALGITLDAPGAA